MRLLGNRNGENIPPSDAEIALARHDFSGFTQLALPTATYASFFARGMLNEADALQGLNASGFLAEKNTPAWQRLWYRMNLTDIEFLEYRKEVFQKFVDLKYTEKGEVFHVAGLLLDLSKNDLINISPDSMMKRIQLVVRKLKKNKLLEVTRTTYDGDFGHDTAYGLTFMGYQTQEFSDFVKYYTKVSDEVRKKKLKDWAEEWMEELRRCPADWVLRMGNGSPDEAWFYNQPVFSVMNPKILCALILNLGPKELNSVRNSLNSRYDSILGPHGFKVEELSFWEAFLVEFRAKVKLRNAKIPSDNILKKWFLPDVEDFVSRLKKLNDSIKIKIN